MRQSVFTPIAQISLLLTKTGGNLMLQNIIRNLSFAFLLLFMCCQSGYSAEAHRFYSGPPLPGNEVALVYAVNCCKIRDVRGEAENETKYLDVLRSAAFDLLDLLPGRYVIGMTYKSSRSTLQERTLTLGDKARLSLNAEKGNVYIIYPAIDGTKWQPVIVNINNYDIAACNKSNKYEDCPSKEAIEKRITRYLNGERPVLKFHPLSETPFYKPVTEDAKRNIKGFWW